MQTRSVVLGLLTCILVAGHSFADTKVVQQNHTDGFTIMKQQQPAKDVERVTWIGDNRLRTDQENSTFIVRPDLKKMYMVNHGAKEYYEIDLPVDMNKLLPPEMAGQMQQMMGMMKMEAKVTPTDETKTVGEWKARRYDVALTSPMMQMKMQVWATKEVKLDYATYAGMFEQTKLLQMGMDQVVAEMRKIDGFQVASEGTMTMMGADVKTSERTISVEETTPPAGTYDPPAGYTKKPFDFFSMQQQMKH